MGDVNDPKQDAAVRWAVLGRGRFAAKTGQRGKVSFHPLQRRSSHIQTRNKEKKIATKRGVAGQKLKRRLDLQNRR